METIFSVRNEDLGHFSPDEAVDFFRELLWAEASSLQIGKNLVNVPSAITVADGGIDAEVRDAKTSDGQGIIKPGLTRYQIKTGAFSPNSETGIKKLLFKSRSRELKPKIKSCLERNGTLVIVLFGWDNPTVKDDEIINKIKAKLIDVDTKYSAADIEIWQQNQLRGFVDRFPSLALKAKGKEHLRFQTHFSWSQNSEMNKKFEAGKAQIDLINNIRNVLRSLDEAVHVRVFGGPGIGKTKLVNMATLADDLRSLTVYCDSASKFKDSNLMNELLRDDNEFSVVLVIDECDSEARAYIWDKLKERGPRIKLVSIYNEEEFTSGNISYFDAPPLENEQISKIIQDYLVPGDQADRWSDICSGSPRVAHVIGQNLKNNPEDLLRPPDTANVWDRYIVGADDHNSDLVRQRRTVLEHLALFKRFGYGRAMVEEAQAIAKIVEESNPQITWVIFQSIVEVLRRKKILQGETTLYITPKALQIKLWIDWWNTHGNSLDIETFSGKLPKKLFEWFLEMFKYAAESDASSRLVEELLGDSGPFQNADSLRSELASHFFLALAEADPKSALKCLKKTIGTQTREDLLRFISGRRQVIWALEKIVVWKGLFLDGARLLLALGEAENETWGNNASGVFADLFSPGPGRVAPTEASPEERFPILREALESSSGEKRNLGLNACNKALESQHFYRMSGPEYQGLRKEAELWMPKTYEEIWDAYRRVWNLLLDKIDILCDDEQKKAVDILLGHARGMGGVPSLMDMVLETLDNLAKKPYVNNKKVLKEVTRVLHYDGKKMPNEVRERWEQLRDDLTGKDFHSLMKRYVGMDLLEDQFDEDGNRIDQVQPQIEELAQKAVDKKELLFSELDWLVTTEAENGYRFGYQLGLRDQDFSLLVALLEGQRNSEKKTSVGFLSGYLRVLFEQDQAKWEELLDSLVTDVKLSSLVPELTWRSGMSDKAATRILTLAKQGTIGFEKLRMFAFGGVIEKLSEDILKDWIEYLLDCSDSIATLIALDLFHFFYLPPRAQPQQRKLPADLTLRLLTRRSLFEKGKTGYDNMAKYDWTKIGKTYVKEYPEKSLQLCVEIFEHFGEEGTILSGFFSETNEVMDEIFKRRPGEAWEQVTKYLGPPIDSRAFHIKEWLHEGAILHVPLKKIWDWVDGNIEKRAWYLASFVPKTHDTEVWKKSLAREVLLRYGQREDVRNNLNANYSSESWTGPASIHHTKKKQILLDLRKDEDNDNVKLWIDEYVAYLDEDIERERIREEREDY